jgi:hypothetical protein
MTIVLAIALAAIALATINLWREAVRRPPRPSEKFVRDLLQSVPIAPKHGKPIKWDFDDDKPLKKWERTPVGTMFDAKRSFFYDFAEFGPVVNSWFECTEDNWRLQELADNELRISRRDPPPDFGRRYSVFYNKAELGVLEIRSAHGYTTENPVVLAEIELHSVRLLDLTTVRSLLQGIATHVSDFQRDGAEQASAQAAIQQSLLQVVWAAQRLSPYPPELSEADWGELECRFHGTALAYCQRP